jgi:hypothetical protein
MVLMVLMVLRIIEVYLYRCLELLVQRLGLREPPVLCKQAECQRTDCIERVWVVLASGALQNREHLAEHSLGLLMLPLAV